MTLEEIYDEYTIASEGFVIAVETHCGYDTSREVIEAIAEIAPTAAEFDKIWSDPTPDQMKCVVAKARTIEPEESLFWDVEEIPAKAKTAEA